MTTTAFQPLRDGFQFINNFTNHVGPITTRGLCGGMSYGALDYFFNGHTVPVTQSPPEGSPLREYIYRRQLDSLVSQVPGFIGKLLPFQTDQQRFSWGVRIEDELGRLCRAIDEGRPAPLGMISVQADLMAHHQAVAIGYEVGLRVEDIRIQIYDPNHPNVVVTLIPVPADNCFRAVLPDGGDAGSWRTYFVDEGYHPAPPPALEPPGWRQNDWRWCGRCQGLAYAGHGPGTCSAGGVHNHTSSWDYVLVADGRHYAGQDQWRWCSRCEGLAYDGGQPGTCPVGGMHDHHASANYTLATERSGERVQNGWKWCSRCQGMAFGGGPPGPCPAGGTHDHSASADYHVSHL